MALLRMPADVPPELRTSPPCLVDHKSCERLLDRCRLTGCAVGAPRTRGLTAMGNPNNRAVVRNDTSATLMGMRKMGTRRPSDGWLTNASDTCGASHTVATKIHWTGTQTRVSGNLVRATQRLTVKT